MSGILLNNGVFEDIGDSCTIQLDPIFQANSFESFTYEATGETATKTLQFEFRYKIGLGGTFTAFTALTNANLLAIPANSSEIYYFEIRIIRTGTDASGEIVLNCIELDSIRVDGCIIVRINKDSYDLKYGIDKYNEIIDKIASFNRDMVERGLETIFPIVDNTITEKTGKDMVLEVRACAKDMNEVLRTLFGNYFSDDLFEIKIDTFDGIRT